MTLEELVRESYDAFNRRDIPRLRELYTPDCIWDGSGFTGWPGETTYRGPEGIAAFIEEWWGAWEEMTVTPLTVEQGPKGLFVRGRVQGVAREGLEVGMDLGQVAHADEHGRISAVYNYSDPDEARRDAGL